MATRTVEFRRIEASVGAGGAAPHIVQDAVSWTFTPASPRLDHDVLGIAWHTDTLVFSTSRSLSGTPASPLMIMIDPDTGAIVDRQIVGGLATTNNLLDIVYDPWNACYYGLREIHSVLGSTYDIVVIDAATYTVTQFLTGALGIGTPRGIAFDGNFIYVTAWDSTPFSTPVIRVIDGNSGTLYGHTMYNFMTTGTVTMTMADGIVHNGVNLVCKPVILVPAGRLLTGLDPTTLRLPLWQANYAVPYQMTVPGEQSPITHNGERYFDFHQATP